MNRFKRILHFFAADDDRALEFQADAVEIERQPVPRSMRILYWVLLGLFLFALTWSIVAKVDKIVMARGKIISTEKTLVVGPLSNSIIKKFHVEVGQVVKAGQPLVSLDPTFALSDMGQVEVRIKSLNALLVRLESELYDKPLPPAGSGLDPEEIALQRKLYTGRQEEFKDKVKAFKLKQTQLTGEIDSFHKRTVNLQTQLAAAKEVVEMRRTLVVQGADTRVSLLDAESRYAALQSETEDLIGNARSREQQLAQTKSDLSAFISGWRNDVANNMADARKERDSLLEQRSKAARLSELSELLSPVEAVVLDFSRVSVGSVVKEGEPILTLVPLNTPLEAEISVLTSDIGYVKLGDLVHLKLDAFPFQRHGSLEGVLRLISEDAYVKSQDQKEATYQARVQITKTRLQNVGAETRLLPGMTLSAEIIVGDRRVITYLLYPLISGLDESIREP